MFSKAAIASPSVAPSNLPNWSPTRTHLKSRQVFVPAVQRRRRCRFRAAAEVSRSPTKVGEEDGTLSIRILREFIETNLGDWSGSFYQFDGHGNLLQSVNTKLSASSYGTDELISLVQTLYIKHPPLGNSILGYDSEAEWAEYKIKETNMFTADKYQQLGFFPKEKAFSLRYQTAGMLETVLRAGVLGEDDIGEESPKNLKLPSRRPSIVCESCLYSLEKDKRVRAFHIMNPQGILEMFIVFLEERGDNKLSPSPPQDISNRLSPFLGRWKGHSITKRSGIYGGTISEADVVSLLQMDDKGQLIQDITSTSGDRTTNVHWTGTVSENLVSFDGGFQMTLLPGGMCMGCPSDISKSVAQSEPFHLEFCWVESPDKRQRLVRTYDVEGLAVSTTYFFEVRV
ncbi:hypothetical protein QJS10_CPA05g01819 [Acorus calamus]|uniref:DUF3598 domain-containing protein n=1 Tax=Acorus calamus TaxID=4465 RepID=A0AAV9ET36_ACOCL|nr:hypothetical protein QJS10_CPA05g01819 [Acorus calamus]